MLKSSFFKKKSDPVKSNGQSNEGYRRGLKIMFNRRNDNFEKESLKFEFERKLWFLWKLNGMRKKRVGKLYSIEKIVVFVCWRMIKLGDRGRSVSNSMNDDS